MRAVGKNIIIKKEKQGISKTKGGLLLTEKIREDLRYNKAQVISIGSEVVGVKENDNIFYDKHAGHDVEFKKEIFQVIKEHDVVIVL
jgi:co-chaperonin GroES (HSP10)|tara:strand:- start:1415 stop:1675 length:261 start_codon:yes stop_codon:yes gene_type:complete